MKKRNNTRETKIETRRNRLEREAQRLQGLQADASKLDERISSVYRRMSNLDPDAFVVVVEKGHDGKATVHGMSHSVSRGIETDGLSFQMEKPIGPTEREYLLIRRDDGRRQGLIVRLDPGQRAEVWIPYGSFPAAFTIFFCLKKEQALAFADKARKPLAKNG